MKQGLIVYLVGSTPLPEPFDLKNAGRSLGHPADRVELVSRDADFFTVEDAWHFLATRGAAAASTWWWPNPGTGAGSTP
jgi:hypothetical protein